ncbi:hypothetical protein OV203_02555 [Nannocystis sp. ILAH1]|uniref:sigma factor n=1 Tax=Nannocystis sp. ILAH1 TaxID=2996789 RepID=UPI002270E532|nr:sigma factor [Nannocystis sp. ILAH1]MCY0985993.1 hypothetical protein [Nannocystis sp. ILAH1]
MSRCGTSRPGLDLAAYDTRRALYLAAGLTDADKVEGHDTRFADAFHRRGSGDAAVAAAIGRRNALAESVDDVARAVARAFARALPALQLHEAEQEARLGIMRAAELWTPAGGASFRTYARLWARKRVGKLADRCRAVTRPERARLAGGGIEVSGLCEHLSAPRFDDLLGEESWSESVADAWTPADVEQIRRCLDKLEPLEREAVARRHGLDGNRPHDDAAAATAMGVDVSLFRTALRRGLEQLRLTFTARPRQIGLW